MSETRQTAIYENLRNAGMGPELAQDFARTIGNAMDEKGTKAILEAIGDVQNRLERIEKTLERRRGDGH